MHILTLLGSPRKHGNTDGVLRRFETKATAMGHVVTRINVVDYEIAGCLGCDSCQVELEHLGCVQNDACEEILDQIIASDLVVYAGPVYCWSFPAQFKSLIDRHYCTVKWQGGEVAARLLHGKRAALVLTCGGDAEDNADLTLTMFERQMDYVGGLIGGMYVLDNCTKPLHDAPRAEALAERMTAGLIS